MIPADVIAEDRRLDDQARTSQEELARLRWHWTLDESNPDRVTFDEYATAVGRVRSAVRSMARGWEAARHDVVPGRSLSEHIELAKVGETKRKAAQAIADANGIRVDNVLSHRRRDVADLIDTATEAAERRGTTVDDEIERAAEVHRKLADVDRKNISAAKARKDARYIEIEGHVAAAMRRMRNVLTLARTVDLADEHIVLINDSIAHMRALLGLIDLQLTGTVDVDWDAELAKIGDAK